MVKQRNIDAKNDHDSAGQLDIHRGEPIMILENLQVPRFNTTLMGVVKGVLDNWRVEASDPMVFGLTGHAFLINIHDEICPSGPYCWNYRGFIDLLKNIGISMHELGFYSALSSAGDRAAVEAKIKDALDQGIPCSLLNLENQLITGYDSTGFFTTQPWAPQVNFPPARLTFGNWQELGKEFHISFYTFSQVEQAGKVEAIHESLDYAVDLFTHPEKFSLNRYGIGLGAYDNWITAASVHGFDHGNWWNGSVWSECRLMASRYFEEIAGQYPVVKPLAMELSQRYRHISELLNRIRNKELHGEDRLTFLKECRSCEMEAVELISQLRIQMDSFR